MGRCSSLCTEGFKFGAIGPGFFRLRLSWCIGEELAPFIASMRRRLHRDVTNTREYYRSLADEMRASLAHPNLSDAQRMERQQKIDSLPAEADRKTADLQHKYDTRIHVRACRSPGLRILQKNNAAHISPGRQNQFYSLVPRMQPDMRQD